MDISVACQGSELGGEEGSSICTLFEFVLSGCPLDESALAPQDVQMPVCEKNTFILKVHLGSSAFCLHAGYVTS